MEFFAFVAAVLVVLGAPALAAVVWRRAQAGDMDSVELVAVAYGGVAVAALSLWLVAELVGLSWRATLLASLLGAAVLLAAPLARLGARMMRPDPGARETPLTGQHDGRAVPDAVAARAPALRLSAPASNAQFAVLAAAGSLFALLAYVPFLVHGWQRADGVHRMAMTDWYKHLITTTALATGDVFPPANPFLHAADAAPYYYGFHLLAASLARLGAALTGGDAAARVYVALLALTLATAWATPFVAYVTARTVAAGRGAGLGDTASVPLLAALGATFLAGFDLVPMALDTVANVVAGEPLQGGLAGLRAAIPSTHLDYWIHHNERQFNAPYLTTIWAPQHMAAVLAALLVVHLVLRRQQALDRGAGPGRPRAGWLLPGLLLAALPALSAYVALGLVAAVAGAMAIEMLRRRLPPWRTRCWSLWLAPAAVAAVASLPVAAVLARGAGGGLTVHVSAAGGWANGALLTAVFGDGWLTGLVDSVAVYVVELGVIGLLAALEIRRLAATRRLLPHQQQVVWMVVTLLIFVLFVRPPVGGPNNLYARPLVFAWFLLAPFAAMRIARLAGLVTRRRDAAAGDPPSRGPRGHDRGKRRWAFAGVALCLLANGYALLGVVLEGALFWATPPETVEVARWVSRNTPPRTVVGIAPQDYASAFGYWMRRPLALADERHALLFGADAADYERVAGALERARLAIDAGVVDAGLAAAGADVFVVARGGGDPAWAAAPCLRTSFRNAAWLVAERVQGAGCGSGP